MFYTCYCLMTAIPLEQRNEPGAGQGKHLVTGETRTCPCHQTVRGTMVRQGQCCARCVYFAHVRAPGSAPSHRSPRMACTVPSELQLPRRALSLMGTVLGSSHIVKMLLWPGACTSSMHLPLSWEDRAQLMGL